MRDITTKAGILHIETHPGVYEPSDDTYLMLDAIDVSAGEAVLDMGTGTGILALYAATCGGVVTAADIADDALVTAEKNAQANESRIAVCRSDLFAAVDGTYDVIIFNPPYVPVPEGECMETPLELAWNGGPDGTRVIGRFLDEVCAYLAPGGRVYLLVSSLDDGAKIEASCAAQGLAMEAIRNRNLFGETLTVFKLYLRI